MHEIGKRKRKRGEERENNEACFRVTGKLLNRGGCLRRKPHMSTLTPSIEMQERVEENGNQANEGRNKRLISGFLESLLVRRQFEVYAFFEK
jgi:hypothetical protein